MRTNLASLRSSASIFYLLLLVSCSDLSNLTNIERRDLASSYYQKGLEKKSDHSENIAMRYFRRAIEADSSFLDAYAGLGEMLLLRKEYSEAERLLIKAPSSAMSDARIWYIAGSAQFHQKKINDAVRSLEKAVQINPDLQDASRMLALLYYDLENYERASEHLEKLLKDSLSVGDDKILVLNMKIADILSKRNPRAAFERRNLREVTELNQVTRGAFAFLVAVSINGNDYPETNINFADVAPGDSMLAYYRRSVGSGILERLPDQKFYPALVLKRRNLAFYVDRILQSRNISANVSDMPNVPADVSKDDFQFDAIRSVCGRRLMLLTKDGFFNPNEPVSGKDLAVTMAILNKMLKKAQ